MKRTAGDAAQPTRSRIRPAPIAVGNALQIDRPQMGNQAGVALYRLSRLAFEDLLGAGVGPTSYLAGKRLGHALALPDLDAFLALCQELRLGIVKIPIYQQSKIVVDVFECVTCSGMQPVGRPLCHFEGGLVAGVIESVLKHDVRAHEIGCIGGLGHESCRFEICPK